MNKQFQIKQCLIEQGLMPLFFEANETVSLQIMEALYKGGVRLIEYTNRGEEALQNFKVLKKQAAQNYPDLFLGVGTIKNANFAELFIDAGADFLISPAFSMDIYKVAIANNILWIPGCMTPTEILHAENSGIELVKLFPGNVLGPSFMQAIKDLFPNMLFMPTGGVDITEQNLKAWFSAGVCAVGMGSKLINIHNIKDNNFNTITNTVMQVLQQIKVLKTQSE